MPFRSPSRLFGALCAGFFMLLAGGSVAASQSGGLGTWRVLHQFERQALEDYSNHVTTSDVIQRGQILMNLARSPTFAADGRSCRQAAEALSYMVSGYYFSAQRLEVAFDWHHYRNHYIARRFACLNELGLDQRSYPLPYWFTSR